MPAICATARPSGQSPAGQRGCGRRRCCRRGPRRRCLLREQHRRLLQPEQRPAAAWPWPGPRGGQRRWRGGARRGRRVAASPRATPPARQIHRAPHRLVHLARASRKLPRSWSGALTSDQMRRDVDEEHVARLPGAVQHVFVGGAHAVGDQAVAHVTAVDIDVLLVGAGVLPQASRAAGMRNAELQRHLAAAGDNSSCSTSHHALFGAGAAPLLQRSLPSCQTLKVIVRPRQRTAGAPPRYNTPALVASLLRNLRRAGVAKKSSRAPRRWCRWRAPPARARPSALRAAAHAARPACGWRCSARPPGRWPPAPRRGSPSSRRSPTRRERPILLVAWRRSASGSSSAGCRIVLDQDGADAAGREAHHDLGGAGVQRVVHQLAHHRGGASTTTSPAAIWLISSSGSSRIGRLWRGDSRTALMRPL